MDKNVNIIPVISKLSRAAAILKHPKMYVTFGTFEEVTAYIQGFYSSYTGPSHDENWRPFIEEISSRLEICDSENSWFDVVKVIREKHPIDQDAIDFMFDELCKFNGVENDFSQANKDVFN